MCTFLSTLPKRSKTAGTAKKFNLVLGLKKCPDTATEKTWYRFRILNFGSQNNGDRDHPFIQRYVHQIWKKNDKGYSEIENEIICPVTKWVDWDGDRYNCPICRFANSQYGALKESHWKNADARQKNRTFSRKYQAIVPVYVVNDPNFEGNNGKFKVIVFSDKDEYKAFYERLEKQLLKMNCFNGVNAADLCLHVSMQETVINEGQPNEYKWNKKVIDSFAFSKPYDLPAITKEAVDTNLPYDETYYTQSTKAEIEEFYNKYIKVSNDDIIESEEDEVHVYDQQHVSEKPTSSMVSNPLPLSPTNAEVTADDIDNVDVDVQPVSNENPLSSDPDNLDADALLAGIEI